MLVKYSVPKAVDCGLLPQEIWQCPETFLIVQTWWGGRDLFHVVVEAKNPAKYPTMHRTATPIPQPQQIK